MAAKTNYTSVHSWEMSTSNRIYIQNPCLTNSSDQQAYWKYENHPAANKFPIAVPTITCHYNLY